ncbi:PadR family transcriptional regulator [Cytobacillus firmus]|uniref:PadR-like family protein transcriptional regulator n=1 Tax=Cytobacillus firmus DS1 TaxID=1307436 RepID=W7KYL4_CYTFI|nr:PadR family transcriptional regulator [Cytobacillus firmus]EWG11213.1 PadR-like family protein transcriptional regulator [Cytobacillus firmus DS1]
MSIQIVILGLLKEKKYHPYEMKKVILEHKWDELFPVTDGNIYHAIRKLEKHKWIHAEKQEQVNNRPNRTVYKITEEGKNQLSEEIIEVFKKRMPEPRSLYPALLFVQSSQVPEAAEHIKNWISDLKAEVKVQHDYQAVIPNLIQEHYKGLNEFYMNWLTKILQVLESPDER